MPSAPDSKAKRQLAVEAVARLRADLRATYSSAPGQRALEHLRRVCNAYVPSYIPGGNTNDAIFAEGRRSVLLEIEAELRIPESQNPQETPEVIKQ